MTDGFEPGLAAAPAVASLLADRAVVAFELWGPGDESTLLAEEAALVVGAVLNRRSQFAAGRACAHRALEALRERPVLAGVAEAPEPLLVGSRRAPLWPPGVTGSISHTEGYAVAVAAPLAAEGPNTIGVDAERVGRVLGKLHERLFVPSERRYLAGLASAEREVAATIMFGAKEAFYKAQFPVTEAWVGFHDVELAPNDDEFTLYEFTQHEFTLHRASNLDVLEAFEWPLRAHAVVRSGVAVTAVTAEQSA